MPKNAEETTKKWWSQWVGPVVVSVAVFGILFSASSVSTAFAVLCAAAIIITGIALLRTI
jgi:hypothetical protein